MSKLDSINLYPEMNKEIVKILSLNTDEPMYLYVAKLIKTLQEENDRYHKLREEGRLVIGEPAMSYEEDGEVYMTVRIETEAEVNQIWKRYNTTLESEDMK